MFWTRSKKKNELPPPPIAERDDNAMEVLRVWTAPGSPQEVVLNPTWKDAGAWGLMLVDIARHAANAYEREGQNRETVLARIRQLFDAEWSSPTDDAKEIDPH